MVLNDNIIKEMIQVAKNARLYAYAPYSNFKVGAGLLVKDTESEQGYKIIGGCNIENAAYSPTNCAERTAVFKAISEGYTCLYAITIVAGKDEPDTYVSPCGVCRQVLREFVEPGNFKVIMAIDDKDYKLMTLEELLPLSFGPDNLA